MAPGEDAGGVRSGSPPWALACSSSAATHPLEGISPSNAAAAPRHLDAKARGAIELVQPKGEN